MFGEQILFKHFWIFYTEMIFQLSTLVGKTFTHTYTRTHIHVDTQAETGDSRIE